MDDAVADLRWDAVRRRRRRMASDRMAELFRHAASALNAGDRLQAEMLLVEATEVGDELEATSDTQRWLRWLKAHPWRHAAIRRDVKSGQD